MKVVVALVSLVAYAFSLDAQIPTALKPLPDGTTQVTLRNNSAVGLAAFAISVKYATETSANNGPLLVYVDSEIEAFPAIDLAPKQKPSVPLPPSQEFVWSPWTWCRGLARIGQFKKMADSVHRWYLPAEQQVAQAVYQSVISKLMDLPEGQVGSPFPP